MPSPTCSLRSSIKRTSRLAASPILPLDYFLNHSKSLSLYRSFIRATRNLGDLRSRWDTIQWIRTDFDRYRGVVESEKAKTLLALGARQLKQLSATGSLIGTEAVKLRGMKGDNPKR